MQKKFLVATTLGVAIVVFVVLSLVRASVMAPKEEAVLTGGLLAAPIEVRGTSYLIPSDEVYDSGRTAEDVPPITAPVFTTAAVIDNALADDVYGIDVEVNGKHRFYSNQMLNWHYVVNDTFEGKDIAVTFDVLTGSSMVYERTLSGTTLSFAATGKVYESSMLLGDGEGNNWWMTRGVAVSGPRVGTSLTVYPSTVMMWGAWRDAYGDTGEVLSGETGYVRDYMRHPYGAYDNAMTVYFPMHTIDSRIEGTKWWTFGLARNGEAMAFTRKLLSEVHVTNETLGGEALVALYDADFAVARVFAATTPDGQQLTFAYDEEKERITDNETGSVWSATGVATSGTLRGTALTEYGTQPMFWFAWASMYPNTAIAADATLHEDTANTNAAD